MRYSDNRMNGHPSWPELMEALDRWGLRIHQRIDNSETILHRKIEDLREEVITLRATSPSQPPTRAARAREWAELIAPLRELVMIGCVMAAGLAALLKAPEVKEVLTEAVGSLERHGRTSD